MTWIPICPSPRLEPERGVAAPVEGHAVAMFRLHDGSRCAIGNVDPFTGASVLFHGIIGTGGGAPTVASPLHKQVYDLRTGIGLDAPEVRVPSYPVRLRAGLVEVGWSG